MEIPCCEGLELAAKAIMNEDMPRARHVFIPLLVMKVSEVVQSAGICLFSSFKFIFVLFVQ